jgi:hypothetical protein
MLADPKALFSLFGQPPLESLRHIHPLGRYVFLAAMISFYFAVAQNRGWFNVRPMSWMKTNDQRVVDVATFVAILSLCLLVLLISWTNGGTLDYSAIGGLLPYSDAAGYFDGAERLLHDGVLTPWAERRPLNSAFFAARLFISGENFYYAMMIQAAVAATALYLASNAVARLQGFSVGVVFFAQLFFFEQLPLSYLERAFRNQFGPYLVRHLLAEHPPSKSGTLRPCHLLPHAGAADKSRRDV